MPRNFDKGFIIYTIFYYRGEEMIIPQIAYRNILKSWWLLKVTYGVLFIVAGLDKFSNLITQWDKYVSLIVLKILPVTVMQLLFFVSIVEIVIGLLILTLFTRFGALLAMAWLLIIVINLLLMGTYLDIAVRDIVMAIGALVLAILTDAKKEIRHTAE